MVARVSGPRSLFQKNYSSEEKPISKILAERSSQVSGEGRKGGRRPRTVHEAEMKLLKSTQPLPKQTACQLSAASGSPQKRSRRGWGRGSPTSCC